MKKLVSLTYPQKSILLTERFYKNASINNICGTAIIDSVLDFDALNNAIKIGSGNANEHHYGVVDVIEPQQ